MNQLKDDLVDLRKRLGLSIHAMSELLYTSPQTYRNWEGGSQPRVETEKRIHSFMDNAQSQLKVLKDLGVNIEGLIPLNLAASTLGIPHETLFHAYRDNGFEGEDLGVLGIWVRREDLKKLTDAVLGR